jgi:hypothetical protein
MFELGALFRAERAAVALLERRDLLLDRLEAKVVCEGACSVAARGLWITDLGPCGMWLLPACVRSQEVMCNRRGLVGFSPVGSGEPSRPTCWRYAQSFARSAVHLECSTSARLATATLTVVAVTRRCSASASNCV